MPTACDNIPCDVDLDNLLIKINSFLTELDAIRQLCTDAKASCENRVKTLEDELDALDEKIDTEIQALKVFLLAELKKISDCACGLKTDVETAATDISRIIQKLKDSNSIVITDGVVTGWNNIWDPSNSGDFVITGDQIKDGTITGADIKDGSITGDKIADGAITTEKLALGSLSTIGSYSLSADVTAILPLFTPLTIGNTVSAGTHTVVNSSAVDMNTMFIISVRMHRPDRTDEIHYENFAVFLNDVLIHTVNWYQDREDALSQNFVCTIRAGETAVIDTRTARTSDVGTVTFTATVTYIGVKN